VFFRKSQEAQASLQRGRLRMTPSSERRTAWKQDYDAMRESMFFGETPTFDEILTAVAEFERRRPRGRRLSSVSMPTASASSTRTVLPPVQKDANDANTML
jgi:hypothetical protein